MYMQYTTLTFHFRRKIVLRNGNIAVSYFVLRNGGTVGIWRFVSRIAIQTDGMCKT